MEKEERRRRKIIARGTDRLALITGRIHHLDQDPFPKSSSFSAPPQDHPAVQHARSSSDSAAPNQESLFQDHHSHGEEDDVPDALTRHDNDEEVCKRNDQGVVFADLPKLKGKEVATLASDNVNLSNKHLEFHLDSITPKEINFSIITSEDIRAMCSIVLAILVVISHIGLPRDALKPKSLVAYRPLCALLLTDVFIVATRLVPYAQIRREDKTPRVRDGVDGENWGGAFKLLEVGLVLHSAIRALFIDLSFYLVIVVCGLSFL